MILTISGASGAGKSSIFRILLERLPDFSLIASHTTRLKRDNDLSGEYIYHATRQAFDKMKREEFLLWWTEVHGYMYATTEKSVLETRDQPARIFGMLLVPNIIEVLKSEAGRMSIKVSSIYVISPPKDILRERLTGRGDSQESIERRLQDCEFWDERAKKDSHLYECFATNNGLIEDTVQEVIKFINCSRP